MHSRALEVADPSELYGDHLAELRRRTTEALVASKLDAVAIAAGDTQLWHRDDSGNVFRPTSEYARWMAGMYDKDHPPATATGTRMDYSGGHVVYFDPSDERPILFANSNPLDPWYLPAEVHGKATGHFKVVVEDSRDKILDKLAALASGKRAVAYMGPRNAAIEQRRGSVYGLIVQPDSLTEQSSFMAHMDWNRLKKTDHEKANMRVASEVTALGHRAALEAFMRGGSEHDVLMAFLQATKTREVDHAYHPIVAAGPHGAILHYEGASPQSRSNESLLIDAATKHNGVSADVTSTFVAEGAHPVFKELVRGLERLQQELCSKLGPQANFFELQKLTHIRIAEMLLEVGVLRDCTPEEAIAKGYTQAFYPHSWGHMIGYQTHDKGQFQIDSRGTRPPDSPDKMILASSRGPLGEDYVVTVEPGIYFRKPILKAKFGNNPHFNWELLNQLEGGIRIETNVLLTSESPSGIVDLTRRALARGTNV